MKALFIVGVLLLGVGIASLVTGGFWFSHRRTDATVGSVQLSHRSTQYVSIGPVIAGVCIVAGIGLVAMGARGK